jgi:hypothetical protein
MTQAPAGDLQDPRRIPTAGTGDRAPAAGAAPRGRGAPHEIRLMRRYVTCGACQRRRADQVNLPSDESAGTLMK